MGLTFSSKFKMRLTFSSKNQNDATLYNLAKRI